MTGVQTCALPIFDDYYNKLLTIINLIIEVDIHTIENLDFNIVVKLKKLLYAVATSAPFTPNISKLSERLGISRPFMIKALNLLEKALLIKQLNKSGKGISQLSKPDKLFLNNTNLIYVIAEQHANTGNLRETFFMNQLSHKYSLELPQSGDFIVNDKYIFEPGGKNKGQKQIQNLKNAFLVKDDIEQGVYNTIPL